MSDFIVTIDDEKFSVNTQTPRKFILNQINYDIEISKLSNHTYSLKLNNEIFHITTDKLESNNYSFLIDGHYFESFVRTKLEEEAEGILNAKLDKQGNFSIKSPMPGLILRVDKKVGEKVEKGESLVLLEAMKMENEIKAPKDGMILEILIEAGKSVEKNQTLIKFK